MSEHGHGRGERRGLMGGRTALGGALWDVFTSDPTTAVSIIDIEGEIIYMNRAAVTMACGAGSTPGELVGRNLADFGMPRAWVEERLGIYRGVCERGEPAMLRSMLDGRQLISWLSPVRGEGDERERPRVIAVTRRHSAHGEQRAGVEGELEMYESGFVRLGELESLTTRELEVLALMGQGLTMREIGQALFRSVKTIENHRNSIGRKLARSRGADLAGIARMSGLKLEDSTRTRLPEGDAPI